MSCKIHQMQVLLYPFIHTEKELNLISQWSARFIFSLTNWLFCIVLRFSFLGEFSQIPLGIFIAIAIVSALLNIFFFYRIKSRYVSFHFAGTIMLLMCQDSIYCQTYECRQHIISTYTHKTMLNVYAEYTTGDHEFKHIFI